MTPGHPGEGATPGTPPALAEAEAQYRTAAATLLDGLDGAIEAWIVRVVSQHLVGTSSSDEFAERTVEVARATHAHVVPALRELLTADVDDQRAGPLAVLRGCVGPANDLLDQAGVTPPHRDPVTVSMFPDDPYDLGPANFDDIDPSLHEIGLVWGAAKAHLVILRHRA